jgi:Ala-tRNA(Pro) deacylase
LVEHPAVYTIEQMQALSLPQDNAVVKNLFLCDAKGRRHFLVTIQKEKKADLRGLAAQLGCSALRFASPERLGRLLALDKGSVTPLGLLNDSPHAVEMAFDRSLVGNPLVGLHPNDNTATVFLSFSDLSRLLEAQGVRILYVDV